MPALAGVLIVIAVFWRAAPADCVLAAGLALPLCLKQV